MSLEPKMNVNLELTHNNSVVIMIKVVNQTALRTK